LDLKLFRLTTRFSRDFLKTRIPDLEALALFYIERAYELGMETGRAEKESLEEGHAGWRTRSGNKGGGDDPGSNDPDL